MPPAPAPPSAGKRAPQGGPAASSAVARAPARSGEPRPRATPPQWSPEPVRPTAPEPPAQPADDGALETGFEILGPLDGDTAPGPPPAQRPRERRQPEADLSALFPPAPAARPAPRQAELPLPAEVHLRRAPAWRRLLSWLADGVLAGAFAWLLVAGAARFVGSAIPESALLAPAALLAALLHFAHAALGHGLAGRTLGKWMLGLLLVGPDGRRPGPGRVAARSLLSLVSVGLVGLGLLLALFDRKGRALHDLAARTAVVRAP